MPLLQQTLLAMAFLCPLFCGFSSPKRPEAELDARIRQFVRNRDFPGAVMIVLHHGKIILRKSWGETSYGSRQKPDPERSVYDLASVTKAVGTSTVPFNSTKTVCVFTTIKQPILSAIVTL